MTLPSFIDLVRIGEIAAIVLLIIQYFKESIPERTIRVVAVLLGIAINFGYIANLPIAQWTPYLIFVTIITGILGGIASDGAYSFLSGSTSKPFSLPSKAQLNGKTKSENYQFVNKQIVKEEVKL